MGKGLRVLFVCLGVAAGAVVALPVGANTVERVSVGEGGVQADGASDLSALSADGRYVVFDSYATNLAPGEWMGSSKVFLRDRQTGATQLVSISSGGRTAGQCYSPSITPDGRFVVFYTIAALVPEDWNNESDVYLHDRVTGLTERVSVGAGGVEGNDGSECYLGSVSADGRYVTFSSWATNLVGVDTNAYPDVFVRDRQTGQTELVSVGIDWRMGDGESYAATISADGRYVAFLSPSTNLVSGVANGMTQVLVRDRLTARTQVVSVAENGDPGDGMSGFLSMSSDGRCVAFASESSNLGGGNADAAYHVFVHDRHTGVTERVSYSDEGSYQTAISGDGRYVAFDSYVGGVCHIFVYDRQAAGTQWVTEGSDDYSGSPSISTNGAYICFSSDAADLVPGDTNGVRDVFLWHMLGADFVGSPVSGPAPLTVSFSDLSGGSPLTWGWDFGDGGYSGEQTPVHVYLKPGRYTVALTVENQADSGTEVKGRYITALFPDVLYDHWAWSDVISCADASIVNGYDDGLYHPEYEVTRDQMAVYIARALVSPSGDAAIPDPEPPPSFSDVPSTHWAYKHIEYAVSQNVVKGYDDGTYQPGLTVDRGTMAVYVARAMVAPGGDAAVPDPPTTTTFPDVPDTFWSYRHVEYCVSQSVVAGYDDGYYRPDAAVSRDQMAVYIARAFELL